MKLEGKAPRSTDSPMILILSLTMVMLMGNVCFGQSYWKRSYGFGNKDSRVSAILPVADGSILLASQIYHYAAEQYKPNSVLLLKLKPDGDTLWVKNYAGSDPVYLSAILPTAEGNFFLGGNSRSEGTGLSNIWLREIDQNGEILTGWTKSGDLYEFLPTQDGKFLIAGTCPSQVRDVDILLMKISEYGEPLWTKTYGNISIDRFYTIFAHADGSFLLGGGFYPDINTSNRHIQLMKIDTNGDCLWTKACEGTESWQLTVVLPADDGDFLLGMQAMYYEVEGCEVQLSGIQPDGTPRWIRKYGENETNEKIVAILPAIDGNFLAGMSTQDHLWLLKINPDGDALWTKTCRGNGNSNDYFVAMLPTTDGNFLLGGYTPSYDIGGSTEYWFIKIKPNGETLWMKTYCSAGESGMLYTMVPSSDGNFLAGGVTYSGTHSLWIMNLIDDRYAWKDSLFTFKIPSLGPDSLNCGFSPLKTPSGMAVSPGGTISWTPETDSAYMEHVEYVVVNDLGRKDTLTFNLFVNCEYGNPVVANKPSTGKKIRGKPFEIVTAYASGGVKFFLPPTAVAVYLYDITGRQVGKVTPVKAGEGAYAVWPDATGARRIPAGKYFAKVADRGGSTVKPFLLMR